MDNNNVKTLSLHTESKLHFSNATLDLIWLFDYETIVDCLITDNLNQWPLQVCGCFVLGVYNLVGQSIKALINIGIKMTDFLLASINTSCLYFSQVMPTQSPKMWAKDLITWPLGVDPKGRKHMDAHLYFHWILQTPRSWPCSQRCGASWLYSWSSTVMFTSSCLFLQIWGYVATSDKI